MTNAPVLAVDYLRRARLRVRAVEALIAASDFADAVRESQETVELAVKALLKLKGLSYPRAHDVARLLRDAAIAGPLWPPTNWRMSSRCRRPLMRPTRTRRGAAHEKDPNRVLPDNLAEIFREAPPPHMERRILARASQKSLHTHP